MTREEIDSHVDVAGLMAAEEAYFAQYGNYVFIDDSEPQGFDPNVYVRIDTYDGPKGKGYQIIVQSLTDIKVLNFGPETERELPWTSL